ncbi:F-box protein CPR1-like [Impatiens glandulifera]|uniref:F-box protein CPR1-like n=1 Tax=Impatiens glandulifera TaxID=253017 RepID=UPI001FB15346|nr:F-box protein CPR1-like [Impatiens glandulifera]
MQLSKGVKEDYSSSFVTLKEDEKTVVQERTPPEVTTVLEKVQDVMPAEFPKKLHHEREVDHREELVNGTKLSATIFYRIESPKLEGLKRQSEELLFKKGRSIWVIDYIDIVVLWNPSTKKSIELPSASIEIKDERRFDKYRTYGFGYDNTNDDYKVVRVAVLLDVVINYEVKVYSLRSNLWHTADKFPNQYPDLSGIGNSVAGGAMHWISIDADLNRSILAFDLGLETYRVIQQPEYRDCEFYSHLDSFEGCLSLTCLYFSGNVDVWLLKQYGGDNEYWSRLITLSEQNIPDTSSYFLRCIVYSKNGKKVLLYMGTDLVWYNLETRSLEDIRFHSEDDSLEACLESLVSIGVAEAG